MLVIYLTSSFNLEGDSSVRAKLFSDVYYAEKTPLDLRYESFVNDREDRIKEWNEYSAEEAVKAKKNEELKEELDGLWGQDLEKWNERREKKYREKALNRYSAKKNPQAIEYKKAPKGAEYDFYGYDSKGRRVRLYDKEHKEEASKEKFKRVAKLNSKYDKIEKGIKKDLDKSEDARATYVILKTGIRPGSDKDTKGDVKAYGLTTLKSPWVTVKGNTTRFKFTGKKGVKIDKKVSDPTVAKIVRAQKKERTDELFPNITDASLRKYAGKYGGKTKDLRTLYANNLAKKLVKQGKTKKEVVAKVSQELQNTPAVAEGSYIEPKVFK